MSEKMHSKEYLDYLKSKQWKQKRKQLLERTGYRCQNCKRLFVPSKLQIHHFSYDRLGNELLSDIIVLCLEGHKNFDGQRRVEKQEEAEDRLYEARLAGWALKVYGDDWYWKENYDEVADRFDEWLEAKGYD